MVHEIIAQFFCFQQRLIALCQSTLHRDSGGHINESHQRCAIGQRRCHAINNGTVCTRHAAFKAGARILQASNENAQVIPILRAIMQRHAGAHDEIEMWFFGQEAGIAMPQIDEGGIEQFQAAVCAKHGDAFFERVECFALHAHQRIVRGFQRKTFGDIIEEIGHAALRIGVDDHAQGARAGQIPNLFERFDGLISAHE